QRARRLGVGGVGNLKAHGDRSASPVVALLRSKVPGESGKFGVVHSMVAKWSPNDQCGLSASRQPRYVRLAELQTDYGLTAADVRTRWPWAAERIDLDGAAVYEDAALEDGLGVSLVEAIRACFRAEPVDSVPEGPA